MEMVIRGPGDGFNETLRVNTALVRRRIRDPKFKIKQMQIGKRSKTDIAVLYIEGITNKEILKMVKERLDQIQIDAVLGSSYIEQLIEDEWRSPFPQIQNTQRPDVVAAALYEGRVAIIIDNTPYALIAPATVATFIQSPEDHYERFYCLCHPDTSSACLIDQFVFAFALYCDYFFSSGNPPNRFAPLYCR